MVQSSRQKLAYAGKVVSAHLTFLTAPSAFTHTHDGARFLVLDTKQLHWATLVSGRSLKGSSRVVVEEEDCRTPHKVFYFFLPADLGIASADLPHAKPPLPPLGFSAHFYCFSIPSSLSIPLNSGPGVGFHSELYFRSERNHFLPPFFFILPRVWDETDYQLIQMTCQSLASYLSCLCTAFRQPPWCVVLPMNLNLVPTQLPSITRAATANSSPASHFSPLKKKEKTPFSSVLRWNCLACLAWKWFLSRPANLVLFHRWRAGLDVRVCSGSYPRFTVHVRGEHMHFCVWHFAWPIIAHASAFPCVKMRAARSATLKPLAFTRQLRRF